MGAFCTCSRTSPFPSTDGFVEALSGETCSALLQTRIDLAAEPPPSANFPYNIT
jgi:hypothetical protein